MHFEAFPMRNERDRAAILRLWHDNFGDSRIKSAIDTRWQWLHDSNPAGPIRICVVVETATGAVVGAAGALPRKLWVRGREVSAAVLCDFVVDKSHRTAGPALVLQREIAKTCFRDGIELLYGFPNAGAFPVLARVGYKTVGEATMWFRPLRTSWKLREYVPEVVAQVAGFVVDKALRVRELQLQLGRKGSFSNTSRTLPDASFQALWDRARDGHAIAGERTPEYLAWRYGQHPIDQCAFFCLCDQTGDRLVAYVAYSVLEKKVTVLDVFWDSREVLQPLFLGFVQRMRAMGYTSISVCHVGDCEVVQPLRHLGFVRSKQQRRFICMVGTQESDRLAGAAYDASQWSLFDGDLDI